MRAKRLLIVVGTRPNYIKVTQFKKVADRSFPGLFDVKIVHTGQHFDKAMADIFFQQLDIWPDYFLNIPSASPNTQIAEIMLRLENVLNDFQPDWVIVPGDVNSTLAAAMCAHKCGFKLAHLESGLRSFDKTMPEEVNRIFTDEISDLFFVTESSAVKNLLEERKPESNIHFVGNTMIDTMIAFENEIRASDICKKLSVEPGAFALITMHRPATVDSREGLVKTAAILEAISSEVRIVFPIHPRTKKNLSEMGLLQEAHYQNILFTEPLDYFSFQNLVSNCCFILTDSGGIQEESTFRKVPCLTLRLNTERPVTIEEGTNTLIPFDVSVVMPMIEDILAGKYKKGNIPGYWDGNSTERILKVLKEL